MLKTHREAGLKVFRRNPIDAGGAGWLCAILMFIPIMSAVFAQPFYFGADLSYVNEMEACGATYTLEGEARDPYELFSEYGCNLVRLRLWHTPSWYDQLNSGMRFSDEADVRNSIAQAKAMDMRVLLAFHLSDNWADPAHQVVPEAWALVVDDLPVLQDSLYNYIFNTLARLAVDSLLPDIIQIGNETNKGILQSQEQNDAGWSLDWPRNKVLFNTAIDAVRDIETFTGEDLKILIHIANPADVSWLMQQFWDNDVRQFDMIGISYYYQYHAVTIEYVGNTIRSLLDAYPGKNVLIVETAYPWTSAAADGANNLLNTIYPGYSLSPENQQKWMVDLTQEVIHQGGSGIIYWEPAWVSTDCRTQWAQGSHWENCTFFDFDYALLEDGGVSWMTHAYDFPTSINESDSEEEFIIYCADGCVNIGALRGSVFDQSSTLRIISTDGKMIFQKSFTVLTPNITLTIPVPAMTYGVYICQIVTKNRHPYSRRVFNIE